MTRLFLAALLFAAPVLAQNPKAEPAAYALLKGAHDNRRVLPETLAGFSADLVYTDGEKTSRGTLVYRREGKSEVKLTGLSKDDFAWLEDKVLNLVGHRRGGSFDEGDGRFPLSLGANDLNDYGQLVKLNDRFDSQYRVKDGKVTEVTRTMGQTKFTITVLQTLDTGEGKYLANHFTVAYRDAKSLKLEMVEGYHDSYQEREGIWLPTGRVVVELADKVSPRVRSFRLQNIQLENKTPETKTPETKTP